MGFAEQDSLTRKISRYRIDIVVFKLSQYRVDIK